MKVTIRIQSYKLQYQDEQGKGIPSVLTMDGWVFGSLTACPKETLFYAVSSTSGTRRVLVQKLPTTTFSLQPCRNRTRGTSLRL